MICLLWTLLFVGNSVYAKPNIVVIVADDLGWSDVGFTAKAVDDDVPESPFLDKLAKDGRVLENFYVQSLCTPTRASLMTGKYPHRLGTLYPYYVLLGHRHNAGLNLENKLLPEYMKDRGYMTHAVGKWHLGSQEQYRPTERGFDSFYGCYAGMIDYLTHTTARHAKVNGVWKLVSLDGDWHNDYTEPGPEGVKEFNDIASEVNGTHATELVTKGAVNVISSHSTTAPMFLYVAYTAPHSYLQPDEEIVRTRNKHIKDAAKRRYAAMVTQLDNGVGEIVQALKERKMWDNTFLLFMSDHGACTVPGCWDNVGGSNKPWRGGKLTLFDGGVKSAAFVRAPWIRPVGTSVKGLMHVTDILPTLLSIADSAGQETYDIGTCDAGTCDAEACSSQPVDIDGVDQAYMLGHEAGDKARTGRESVILNLARHPQPADEKYRWCDRGKDTKPLAENYAGVRYKHYKLLEGHGELCDSALIVDCPPLTPYLNTTVMLFDLEQDPGEQVNVAERHPDVVEVMMGLVRDAEKKAVTNYL